MASSSASSETRAEVNDKRPTQETQFESMTRVPTRHEDLQELGRKISRQSQTSTRTQDPTSDDFDFKQHLRHVLNKGEKEGIKVSSPFLRVDVPRPG